MRSARCDVQNRRDPAEPDREVSGHENGPEHTVMRGRFRLHSHPQHYKAEAPPRSGAVSPPRLPLSTNGCVAVAAVVKVSWRPANLRHGRKGPRDVRSRLGLP